MHRSKGSFRAKAIQRYQETLKKINRRRIGSIWDIINDSNLNIYQKVDYIRHHFVYYDGNYELFHDENGKPTETKHLLDDIIKNIIKGTTDPSELSEINKQISILSKERKLEEKQHKEKELDSYILESKKEKTFIKTEVSNSSVVDNNIELAPYKKGIVNAEIYFKLIDEYLDNLPKEERIKASAWKYKELKKVAKRWAMNNRPSLFEAKDLITNKTQEQQMTALLNGYKKYAAEKWKN